jgi:hypothetical protein
LALLDTTIGVGREIRQIAGAPVGHVIGTGGAPRTRIMISPNKPQRTPAQRMRALPREQEAIDSFPEGPDPTKPGIDQAAHLGPLTSDVDFRDALAEPRFEARAAFKQPLYLVMVALLLALCVTRGYWLLKDLPFAPYQDSMRDVGLIQGILDGNFLGDPTNAGAWRWYPPLIHFLIAGAVKLTGIDTLKLWLATAPALNLVAPATFFLMSASLIGLRAATFAIFAFVLLDGAVISPWDTATYASWPYTPTIAAAFFYLTIFFLHRRVASARFRDAAMIGAGIGLTFLAHTIPGLLLVPIVTVTCVVALGVSWRAFWWLAVVGVVTILLALLMTAPLIRDYHLHIHNFVPVMIVDPYYTSDGDWWLRFFVHLPALLALAVIAVLPRKGLDRVVVALLATWIIACVVPLARQLVCWPIPNGTPGCNAFALPIQHFHVYLKAAEAVLIGYAACRLYDRLFGTARRGTAWAVAGKGLLAVLVVLGATCFLQRPNDQLMLDRVATRHNLDYELYRWVLAQTRPDDLFVTDLPNEYRDPAALAVFMAGRHLVAAPAVQSNPYLDWEERNRRRLSYYRAARGDADASPLTFCRLLAEAAPGAAYIVLPNTDPPAPVLGSPLFRSPENTIFKLDPNRITLPSCR